MLNFEAENNKGLDITKEAKVVEAHLHNTDRVTLVYKELGSFTFRLSELDGSNRIVWNIETKDHKFTCVQNKMRVAVSHFSRGKGDKMASGMLQFKKHFWFHLPEK